MEKILLPEHIGYKANLHSHSTDSDGDLTPEQMKEYYKANGYSILAYTDHLYMRDRTSLNDEEFVALNGYENSINQWGITPLFEDKCYHLNFYSPAPDKVGMVGIFDKLYRFMNLEFENSLFGKRTKTPEQLALAPLLDEGGFCDPTYSLENANKIIAKAKELGYLVILNHPHWSRQTEEDWLNLKGLTAMEIFNYGCWLGGWEEENDYIYDTMLRAGQRISCVANDDNHNNVMQDSFGGFNIMYPKKLDYTSVFNALRDGDMYASSGGILRGVTVLGDRVYVGAENAAYIRLKTNGRFTKIVRMKDKPLTDAVFELHEALSYFRIIMEDINGKRAYTRAYFRNAKGEWE